MGINTEELKNLSKEEQDKILKESEALSEKAKLIKLQRNWENTLRERKKTCVKVIELNEENISRIDNLLFPYTDNCYFIFTTSERKEILNKLERRGLLLSIKKAFRPIKDKSISIMLKNVNYYESRDVLKDYTYNEIQETIVIKEITEFISLEDLEKIKNSNELLCLHYKRTHEKWTFFNKLCGEKKFQEDIYCILG